MPRRGRGGRDIAGWLPLDKPPGASSADMVHEAKRALSAKKAGHAGTLDRPASGVLAIAFGEATKTVPYVAAMPKCYVFTVEFGKATETDDATGETVAESARRPADSDIAEAIKAFQGDIMQVPPKYSAVKVEGTRAYKHAVNRAEFELAARPLEVREFRMLERVSRDRCTFKLICGKGGYVRSIARDLGEELGCYGHVHELRRIWSGPFSEADCVSLQQIRCAGGSEELDGLLQPLETALSGLPEVKCSAEGAIVLRKGQEAPVVGQALEFGASAWASHQGTAVAIGVFEAGVLRPTRVFKAQRQVLAGIQPSA